MTRTPKPKPENLEHPKDLVAVAHAVEAAETREEAERAFKKVFPPKSRTPAKHHGRHKPGHD